MTLSSKDLEQLDLFVSSGDRIGYYTFLAEHGDRYAPLALSVVNNSSASGSIANEYILQSADGAGVAMDSDELATIGLELMRADRLARGNGADNLSVTAITNYHLAVFGAHGLPPQAWTAYTPLLLAASYGEAARDGLWEAMLTNSFWTSTSATLVSLMGQAFIDLPEVAEWLTDVSSAVLSAQGASNAYGDYDVGWNAGNVIGGSENDDVLNGSSANDIIMTFDGNANVADGAGGDDTIYGGVGSDTLIGGVGKDLLHGGGGQDKLVGGASLVGPDTFNLDVSHKEWDDRLQDRLSGDDGADKYYVYSSYTGIEVPLTEKHIVEYIEKNIDYVDATDADFSAYYQFLDYLGDLHTFEVTADLVQAALLAYAETGVYDFGEIEFTYPEGTDDSFTAHVYGSEWGNDLVLTVDVSLRGVYRILGGLFDIAKLARPDINGSSDDDDLRGSNGSEHIYGGEGSDSIDASGGNDTIDGDRANSSENRASVDTFSTSAQWVDTVNYQGNYTDYTLTLNSDGTVDVSIGTKTDHLINIERVQFAGDNSMYILNDVLSGSTNYNAIDGTLADDVTYGTYAADVITGGHGNDILIGGDGADVYVYSLGDGNDIIGDVANFRNEIDILRFTDLNAEDVSFIAGETSLIVTVLGDGSTIEIVNQYSSSKDRVGIEKIEFADGSHIDLPDILAIAHITGTSSNDVLDGRLDFDDTITGGLGSDVLRGSTGNDTYIYARGDGDDVINDGGWADTEIDVLRLNDINQNEVVLARSENDLIITDLASNSVITIAGQFYSRDGYDGIERIEFADGSKIEHDTLQSIAWTKGTEQDDVLSGTDGEDTFAGGEGADTLSGGLGADAYYYWSGDGNDLIADNGDRSWETDQLSFRDLNQSDLRFERSGSNLIITVLADGARITVENQFLDPNSSVGVEDITFADGSKLSRSDIDGLGWVSGTDDNDVLNGTADDDVFIGRGGDDTLVGESGSDIYFFNYFDGNDTITDLGVAQSDKDELRIRDAESAAIDFVRDGDDLLIRLVSQFDYSEEIRVTGQFDVTTVHGIELVEFVDGEVVFDRSDILTAVSNHSVGANIKIGSADADFLIGSDQNDAIYTGSGNDTVYLYGGDDYVVGGKGNDRLVGSAGSDTYVYKRGDGTDVIDDQSSDATSIDKIQFTDLNVADISAVRNGADLAITVLSSGEQIIVSGQWYDPNAYWGLENIEFADGTVWDRTTIMAIQYGPLIGTSGDDSIVGTGGDDVLQGLDGNDTLNGGDGNDSHFGGGGDDLLIGNVGNDSFDGGDGSDTLDFTYYAADHNIDLSVGKVLFLDGTFETAINIENVIAGGGANQITGSAADNRIDGGYGNDSLSGGDGNDVLIGGDGDDTLSGGNGNDHLSGGVGADSFDGGAGTDIADFSYSSFDWTLNLQTGHALSDGTDETLVSIEGLVGSSGNDTLIGDGQANSLEGWAGNDTLSGAAGSDTFVFRGSFGHDTITDFVAGGASDDVIDIEAFADFAAVLAAATQVGDDTLITADANNSVLLKSIPVASLHQDDFRFASAA